MITQPPPIKLSSLIGILGIAFVLLAGGCMRTVQPVLNEDQVYTDDSLAGKWVNKEDASAIEIQSAVADKSYAIAYTDKDGKKSNLIGRLGKIGDVMIVDITPPAPAEGENDDIGHAMMLPLHSLFIIRSTQPELTLATFDLDWVRKFMGEHPTELQRLETGNKEDMVISSSTADIQQFVTKHQRDPGALGKDAVFVRPPDAHPTK
ncbi:MAG: hypothetical protein JO353_08155 [Phycisphaerae bacterium]|nr:hypothetical protein [Phycisphaerae bacterium]